MGEIFTLLTILALLFIGGVIVIAVVVAVEVTIELIDHFRIKRRCRKERKR